jgi:hypothetical protein
VQGSIHSCPPGMPTLAEPSREGPPREAVLLRADARDTSQNAAGEIIRRKHSSSPQARQDDEEIAHHGVPAFLHLARAHQIPMRAPAGAEVLQPGFLHQLSMRLETALLRGQAILRGRCCERGAKGGQEQDGQNRFFHELLLQNGLRHGLPSLSNDLRLPTKPQYARTAQSVTFAPACNR